MYSHTSADVQYLRIITFSVLEMFENDSLYPNAYFG